MYDPKGVIGRPSLYTDELADEMFARITQGESLASICADDHMPSVVTFYSWIQRIDGFLKKYEIAKDAQADFFVEQMLVIPDTEQDVQRARLKVDVRKWAASKYKPKKYGEKVTQEISGPDGGPIPTANAVMTGEELRAMIKQAEQDV